jgi:hypothetical protein
VTISAPVTYFAAGDARKTAAPLLRFGGTSERDPFFEGLARLGLLHVPTGDVGDNGPEAPALTRMLCFADRSKV